MFCGSVFVESRRTHRRRLMSQELQLVPSIGWVLESKNCSWCQVAAHLLPVLSILDHLEYWGWSWDSYHCEEARSEVLEWVKCRRMFLPGKPLACLEWGGHTGSWKAVGSLCLPLPGQLRNLCDSKLWWIMQEKGGLYSCWARTYKTWIA